MRPKAVASDLGFVAWTGCKGAGRDETGILRRQSHMHPLAQNAPFGGPRVGLRGLLSHQCRLYRPELTPGPAARAVSATEKGSSRHLPFRGSRVASGVQSPTSSRFFGGGTSERLPHETWPIFRHYAQSAKRLSHKYDGLAGTLLLQLSLTSRYSATIGPRRNRRDGAGWRYFHGRQTT